MLKSCIICGEVFEAKSRTNVCSEKCRLQRENEGNKRGKRDRTRALRFIARNNFEKTQAACDHYNSTYGTSLSYGMYQAMLYNNSMRRGKDRK